MKKLLITILFLLLTTNCFTQETEIISKRTYNQKVYDLQYGKYSYKIYTAHKHYKDMQGNFQDIDSRLIFDNITKQWKHNKASYHPKLPEKSDGEFEFRNVYVGLDGTLKVTALKTNKVAGVYYETEEGNFVLYKDAYGVGIDLKVYSYWAGIKKVIIINKKPIDTAQDLTFDFDIVFPTNAKITDKDGIEWDKNSILDFKSKTIKIGDGSDKGTYFRDARIWDSADLNQSVDIMLIGSGGKYTLRKTITSDILKKAIYPLYTDHPTSYYAGAGDGYVFRSGNAETWATAHALSSATNDYIGTACTVGSAYMTTPFTIPSIYRGFFPIDTSGIDDSATITAALLYLYVSSKSNGDNDGDDWINVVQTSQSVPTILVAGDFDQCGSITNPTEGATRIDIGNITTSAYKAWTLDATGRGWIDKINVNNTLLGLREGHDALNNTPSSSTANSVGISTSEDTSGTKDPYLDVTVSEGATSATGTIMTVF